MDIHLLTTTGLVCYFALLLMEIVMYLDEALIDSIPLETESVSKPGYLSAHVRTLRERHAQLVENSGKEPQFLLKVSTRHTMITEDEQIQGKLF